jgi:hypothetical protein
VVRPEIAVPIISVAVSVAEVMTWAGFNPDAVGVISVITRLAITLRATPAVGTHDPAFRHPGIDLDFLPIAARRSDYDGGWAGVHHGRGVGINDRGSCRADDHRRGVTVSRSPDIHTNANVRIGAGRDRSCEGGGTDYNGESEAIHGDSLIGSCT